MLRIIKETRNEDKRGKKHPIITIYSKYTKNYKTKCPTRQISFMRFVILNVWSDLLSAERRLLACPGRQTRRLYSIEKKLIPLAIQK
jgi:hypothetical protein